MARFAWKRWPAPGINGAYSACVDFTRQVFFANGNIRKFKTFVSMETI